MEEYKIDITYPDDILQKKSMIPQMFTLDHTARYIFKLNTGKKIVLEGEKGNIAIVTYNNVILQESL